ncbi:salicylate hydroxylase [Lipomyces tetrasporus]|uniref:Salicylate hydroxylase n=1 Tax=Lipomyces tetrasporus TaxID=54092 RepID=A0AAD7QLU6_9ASCO|nr:salicylate hydroxylase [Lipomyces tetrasporus]KAJ8097677.1 salicylate hydroxylase [Lipomyces tetrasporus]
MPLLAFCEFYETLQYIHMQTRLALGLLLRQRGIRPTIYELRSKLTPQELAKPSGMLDLHDESGLRVMRECGLWDSFQAAVGNCSEACRVLKPQSTVLHTDEGELASRPEIARNALTKLLIENLPSDFVNDRDHALDLGANGTATYDFVVGADGAWSRVRKLLTDFKPYYSGAQLVTVTVKNSHLVELNGSGTLYALGGGNGMITYRGPQDSIRVYAAVSAPREHWAKAAALEGKSAAEVKMTLLSDDKLFSKWASPLQDLLATACDEDTKDNPAALPTFTPSPLYMLPIGSRWELCTGATLVGDAAHLMKPWAGEGVNRALWDSLDMAHALGGHEEAMLLRAKEKAEETANMFLSENGGQAMADMFKMFEDMAAAGRPPEGQ